MFTIKEMIMLHTLYTIGSADWCWFNSNYSCMIYLQRSGSIRLFF